MATLVLTTVGRAAAGPLGAVVGASVGSIFDRLAFGDGRAREVGRLADLSVQSSAYGAPLPIIHGRMRIAGNVIWSTGIDERRARSRGKGRSRATVFSYTSSFAVALAARPIQGVARIWADGRLLRDGDGIFTSPVTWRLHRGGEDQDPDPLIAAAEGDAPAYRGLAYAVFEDLPLVDWGNRIPNLMFEVIADATPVNAATVVADAAGRVGATLTPTGAFPDLDGHAIAGGGSIVETLAPLLAVTDASSNGLSRLYGRPATAQILPAADVDSRHAGGPPLTELRRRAGRGVDVVELVFHDSDRDFQLGLQRAWRGQGRSDRTTVPAALSAEAAKSIAAAMLAARTAGEASAIVHLPWRHLGIDVGTVLTLDGETGAWRVASRRFEGFVVTLELTGVDTATLPTFAADPGRVARFDDRAAGPTSVQVLDLPPLPGDLPTTPRLWVAAAGAGQGWRLAPVSVSRDGGASFAAVGEIVGGTIMGQAVNVLGAGPVTRWDGGNSVDVALLSSDMWLESASEAAVLAGANLALIGSELVQFAAVEALAPGRFRLSRLLRGRRGSEAAVIGHGVGDRFVLLDPGTMLPLDPDLGSLGQGWLIRPDGTGDLDADPVPVVVGGRALRPLSPVHVRVVARGDDRLITWVRRSRAGFGWNDLVDAPLAEATEAWRLTLRRGNTVLRQFDRPQSDWLYPAAARVLDGPDPLTLDIAQLSEAVGPGAVASILL